MSVYSTSTQGSNFNPVVRGVRSLELDPTCPIIENNKDGPRCTLIYTAAQYATAVAAAPDRLTQMSDAPSWAYVDTVRVEKIKGGGGKLTITLTPSPVQDYTFDNNQTQEVEWIEIEKPLLQHPAFNPTSSTSNHPNAGKYALTDTDRAQIAQWELQADATARAAYQYDGNTALSDNAKQYAMRILKGETAYKTYLPVVRQTAKFKAPPAANQISPCGRNVVPPYGPNGFAYIQTADRSIRDRNWSRMQEWTGFDDIDTLIYPSP